MAAPQKTNVVELKPAPEVGAKKQFIKLLREEIAVVSRLIVCNAEIDDAKKIVTYNKDWNDERIAAMLRAKPGREQLTAKLVAGFRKEMFGRLPDETTRQPKEKPASEMAEIKAMLADINSRLTAVEDAVSRPS